MMHIDSASNGAINRSARWLTAGLIAALAALALPAGAQHGEPPKSESAIAFEAARAAMKSGPADIALGAQATLKLPPGYLYVPTEESRRVLQAMGNRSGPALLGMVFPAGEAGWFVVMQFQDAGYVKDDDARDWKADELLDSLKKGTEAGNEDRRKRNIGEIEVSGWVEPPRYDAASHRLVWSASVREKGAPADSAQSVNYNTYALGREGYISLNLVTALQTIERDKSVAHELLGALNYLEGKRYGDFNSSTDRVAEYGLAALIGGLAAKKLGLLAVIGAFLIKFWKVGLIALAGLGALLPRLRRKKSQDGAPPAAPPAA